LKYKHQQYPEDKGNLQGYQRGQSECTGLYTELFLRYCIQKFYGYYVRAHYLLVRLEASLDTMPEEETDMDMSEEDEDTSVSDDEDTDMDTDMDDDDDDM